MSPAPSGPCLYFQNDENIQKSWAETKVTREWSTADIRPIPKRGKDLHKLESNKPICLTSTVGKMMEHLIISHLRYFAESKQILIEHQAGFENRRGSEDKLLLFSQSISDGFRQSSMQRTMVAHIAYSRSYDKTR